jgi:hypothetical protein
MTRDPIRRQEFLPIERDVIEKLLAGPGPLLGELREQFARSSVAERSHTASAFYTEIYVPGAEPVPGSGTLTMGDVAVESPELRRGAGFVLWVKGRVLSFLEGYTFGMPWPAEGPVTYSLYYTDGDERLQTIAEVRAAESSAPE